ncbi:HAMP domain-containing sensor histidine kinase [Clostridium sp.]|uniref:HAMP domain-containing sensor histidine kinase n=1 Tax=Clostridium sp. TaxID=1506 RepID=UPI0032175159
MDTKLKNINDTEKGYEEMIKDGRKINIAKIIAMVIMAIMVSISVISLKDINSNRDIYDSRSLYGNGFLGSSINEFTNKVVKVSELYKSEEYIKDRKNLTKEEIALKRQFIESQFKAEYEDESEKIYDENDTSDWSEKSFDDAKSKIRKTLEEKYTYTDEELENLIIEEKLADFNRETNLLNTYDNLKFIAYDKGNSMWITNYDTGKEAIAELKKNSGYFAEYHISNGNEKKSIFIDGDQLKSKELNDYSFNSKYDVTQIQVSEEVVSKSNNYYEEDYLTVKSDLDIYISVPKNLVAGGSVYNIYSSFLEAKVALDMEIGILLGGLLGIIIMIFILKKFKGKYSYMDEVLVKLSDVTLEIKGLILFLGYIVQQMFFHYNLDNEYRYTINLYNIILIALLLVIYYIVIKSIIQSYKEGTILRGSYFVKLYEVLKVSMEKGSFGRRLTRLIGAYLVICLGVSFILCLALRGPGLILAIGFCIIVTAIVVFKLVKEFAYLNRITNGAKQISEGKMSEDILEEGKGALKELAHSINNMKQGLRKSIENENKSERMKTELITNVSHDLKTPLTSIINYVDLLKRADIEPEEARAYVEVLDKKSQRLKILIEDLFEASKAASGAMQLTFTKIEVSALLRQSLGEAERRIEEANLDFKTNIPQEKIYINADGIKIWRVFENLISNSIKYSLKGTRVYVDVKVDEDKVYVIMKNISAFELNFDASEITERFKRGEESRNTEGSGLGLAIAKNIIELHGGKLEVGIDGDLFKATVELPREKENIK